MSHQWLVHVNPLAIIRVIRVYDIVAFGMGDSMAALCC